MKPTLRKTRPASASAVDSWACAAAVLVIYFGYVLALVCAPGFMARPLVEGSHLNVALVLGMLVIVVCIGLTFAYTAVRNRRDRQL